MIPNSISLIDIKYSRKKGYVFEIPQNYQSLSKNSQLPKQKLGEIEIFFYDSKVEWKESPPFRERSKSVSINKVSDTKTANRGRSVGNFSLVLKTKGMGRKAKKKYQPSCAQRNRDRYDPEKKLYWDWHPCWDASVDRIILNYSDLYTLILQGIMSPLDVKQLKYLPESSFKNDYLLTELVLGVVLQDINQNINVNTGVLRREFFCRVMLNFDISMNYGLEEFLESQTTIFDFNPTKKSKGILGAIDPMHTRIT